MKNKKMKVFLFLLTIGLSIQSQAGLTMSLGTATWQEKIPVIYLGNEVRAKTSFTGIMVGVGFMVQLTKRWKWDLNANMIAGLADIQKLEGATVPRRNVNSMWFPNRFLYFINEKVAFGPNVLINLRKIDGLDPALSSGGFLDIDYKILEKTVLSQSFGSISDSKELAYSIKFTKEF